MSLLKEATEYLAAGLSVIPCVLDPDPKKDKTPRLATWEQMKADPEAGSWKPYQKERPTQAQLNEWFKNGAAIGVIGGVVSGNLEIIDFDIAEYAGKWSDLLKSWGCGDLLKKLVTERSKRGGFHVAYRHTGVPMGNQKLAWHREANKASIETRGEGGYVIAAPSEGYTSVRGKWTALPTISADERDTLLSAARTFNQKPDVRSSPSGRVGDDYNDRAVIHEILSPHGWTQFKSARFWTRPGKSSGVSLEVFPDGKVQVYTSSVAGLDPGQYDLFGLYARLWHDGNFTAAAKKAGEDGFGTTPQQYQQQKRSDDRLVGAPAVSKVAGFRSYSDIQSKKVEWLWHPYIPIGGLTLLCGNPGIGKSTFAFNLAAMLSNGHGGGGFPAQTPKTVLLYCLEDDAERVIKNKLVAAGADMSKVIDGVYHPRHNPEGISPPITAEKMRAIVEAAKTVPDLGLVIFDPVVEWFPADRSVNTGNETREVMRHFRDLCEQAGISTLLLAHPNKAREGDLLMRVSGSIDFAAIVRSLLFATKIPDSDDHAILHVKANWGPMGHAIGYDIDDEGRFFFTGQSDVTQEMLAAQPPKEIITPTMTRECKDWLVETLKGGALLSEVLFKGAKDHGFSRRTVERARQEMGKQITCKPINGKWNWALSLEFDPYWDC